MSVWFVGQFHPTVKMKQNDTNQYVAYLRVSTQKQGYSGLGLEAQKEIIKKYLVDRIPLAEYVEIESGRHNDRKQLSLALSHCRESGATLIVAKLDRLSRSVSFLSQLLESDVDIIFCDFPQANKMVLHIIAAIAQYEAELTATRTRQALAAKKSKGYTLGNPEHLLNKHHEAIRNSNETNRKKAAENPNNKRAVAMLRILHQEGLSTREMARKLNDAGFTTSQGYPFRSATISKLTKRYINHEKERT